MKKFYKSFICKIALVFAMTLMFGILSSGNVYAATVGDTLTQPEAGWQRIDDTDKNIQYIGSGWEFSNTVSGNYQKTQHWINNKLTSYVRFKFYGTRLRLITTMNNSTARNIFITIDGSMEKYNAYDSIPYLSGSKYLKLAYEKNNMNCGYHDVTIKLDSNASSYGDAGNNVLAIDAFDIDSTGYIIDPSTVLSIGISLNKTIDDIILGQTDVLTATITPENATNKNVKWTSSDPSIATVDENGKVTAVKEGTTTVSAITMDGSNLSASCVVTVKPKDTTPPTDSNGNAILTITMTNGNVKSYTVSMTKVNDFISWYNNRSSGSNGSPYYAFDKTDNLQPFVKKTEYIVFDKISSFEVDEYSK